MTSLRLKISVSGVRGIVGETLTPQLLVRFAQAFGTYIGPGKVLVGRNTRPSGPMVASATFAGLMATGCRPIDLGVAPIPAIQYRAANRSDVCGAVAITASHNPAEWNALKLLSGEGLFLSGYQAEELLDIYHQGDFQKVPGKEIRGLGVDSSAVSAHLERVVAEVDADAIRAAKVPVAVDCVNGAGAVATPELMARLGCDVVAPLGCEATGLFHRPPEPIPEHLGDLVRAVSSGPALLGFAQDADADRLAVVDEAGRALDGDVMLALLIDLVLARKHRPVVVNLSTSNLVDHVARKHGVPLYRSAVGEANVVAEMIRRGAVVGGEGSGGLIYPAVHSCRDSFVGMALLLDHVALGGSVAALVDELPPRVRLRTRREVPLSAVRRALFHLRPALAKEGATLDTRDGLKATWPHGWIHVRPSNTEPILRLIVEAESQRGAEALEARAEELLDEVLS